MTPFNTCLKCDKPAKHDRIFCERCTEQIYKNVEGTRIKKDNVNSPGHYTQGKFETIDIILDTVKHLPGDEGYLVGNIIKYLSRYAFKNGTEDVEKAKWYINKLVEVRKNEEEVRSRKSDN